MFGFGERSKLNRLQKDTEGWFLAELLSKFTTEEEMDLPNYDEQAVAKYAAKITDEEHMNIMQLMEKCEEIRDKNNFERSTIQMYLCWHTNEVLRGWVKVMKRNFEMESIFKLAEDEAEYLYDNLVKEIPLHYILPLIFPPKVGDSINSYGIAGKTRIDLKLRFFSELRSFKDFVQLVDQFVYENPYYYLYPLK